MNDPITHVDVLIVGAGLSGIGLAWHLQQGQPHRSYAILEARDASGGTWDLFRYPGVRSDSDLATFAYGFKPWTGEDAIADGASILRYLRETAAEHGIDRRIRYGHNVRAASWSGAAGRWNATAVALVPALARLGAHVTMLQRSPSYVMPVLQRDAVGDKLRAWFGDARGHRLTRRKNIWQQRAVYRLCRRHPTLARRVIRRINARMLPAHVDVDTHFNPRYDPWDQRLCAVPNGDLFRAFRDRTADIVTAGIDRYVLRSLAELPKQGARDPWRVVMDYREDVRQLRRAPVADPALRFG